MAVTGESTFNGLSTEASGPFLGEKLAIEVNDFIEHAESFDWDDWLSIINRIAVEREVATRLRRIILSGKAGRLTLWAPSAEEAAKGKQREFRPWCKEEESKVQRGDSPGVLEGPDHEPNVLVYYLLDTLLDQYNIRVNQETDPLNRIAMQQTGKQADATSYSILRFGVLLDETKPGSTVVVTGPPGSGKTHLAVLDLLVPALQMGWHVISNILIQDIPPTLNSRSTIPPERRFHYVRTLSELLKAVINIGLEFPRERILVVRDEGTLGRQRSTAQSQRNRDMKMLTMINRKFRVIEVNLYQISGDVPAELREFCSHRIAKPSQERQDLAYVVTPIKGLKHRVICDIPGIPKRLEMGLPVLYYNDQDIAPLSHDVPVLSVLDQIAKVEVDPETKKPRRFEDQLVAMMEYIDTLKGRRHAEGFNEEELMRIVLLIHRNYNIWGYRKIAQMIDSDLQRLSLSHKWVYNMVFAPNQIRNHENRMLKWCPWCAKNRTTEHEGLRGGKVSADDKDDPDASASSP